MICDTNILDIESPRFYNPTNDYSYFVLQVSRCMEFRNRIGSRSYYIVAKSTDALKVGSKRDLDKSVQSKCRKLI